MTRKEERRGERVSVFSKKISGDLILFPQNLKVGFKNMRYSLHIFAKRCFAGHRFVFSRYITDQHYIARRTNSTQRHRSL